MGIRRCMWYVKYDIYVGIQGRVQNTLGFMQYAWEVKSLLWRITVPVAGGEQTFRPKLR
jgi:hypothetical protein